MTFDIFTAEDILPSIFFHVTVGAGDPLNAQWMATKEPTDVSTEAPD